jgi:tetratricopeptide (TPR) repeat protein
MTMKRRRSLLGPLLFALSGAPLACAAHPGPPPQAPLAELREDAERSSDAELRARWLLRELISSGGDAARAKAARQRLDAAPRAEHYLAHFARGLDDAWHGRLASAPEHFLNAVVAAQHADGAEARLVAWLSATRALALRSQAPGLWAKAKPVVAELMKKPGGIGWRAHSELARWWLLEGRRETEAPSEREVSELGCVTALRVAGPFGGAAPVYLQQSFPPEAPGAWPQRWPDQLTAAGVARVLPIEREGCEVGLTEKGAPGVYYVEGFFELPEAASTIVLVQGALGVWVDDRRVLERDPKRWGIWPKFGAALALAPGRHRLVARLSEGRTLVRLIRPDGTPLPFTPAPDPGGPYVLSAPTLLPDPNELMHFIADGDVVDPHDDVLRFLGTDLLRLEGQQDVASVLLEPLVAKPEQASGPSLATAALLVPNDPIYSETQARDLERELLRQAVKKDPELWQAELGVALAEGNAGGLTEVVKPLRRLTERFGAVPAIWGTLANVYGRLGWQPEYRELTRAMAERFPNEPSALTSAVEVHESTGQDAQAARLVERLMQLDPDSEVLLDRAVRRHDYAAAQKELERLVARKQAPPQRLLKRRYDLRYQAGDTSAEVEALNAVLAENPRDTGARLALADTRLADGEPRALHDALAEATESGADTGAIERAIDVVEARTDFAPYRLDARQVIAEYEAAGLHLPGTAARVLDYAAVWVHSDGSSRMLEHEIVRLQSDEAITQFAEHQRLEGLVLNMRVIKQDGRTFEPEVVTGKPTVTFPHLGIGDYIETEHVQSLRGDPSGQTYQGPRWFFREENVAYAHSEFVLIAPKGRALTIELTGQVPEPAVSEEGPFVTRRWRVDHSPAAPVEPLSAPLSEFLPSLQISWGIDIRQRLRLLSEQVAETTPVDPRIARIARRIVEPLPATQPIERAQRLYRWVQDNVEDGQETDGRQVIVGRRGNRWRALRSLLTALDIPVGYAIAKNRLAPPPLGPQSDAETYMVPLLRVGGGEDATWLTVQQKHAPFGYVPVEARGMPAFELSLGESKAVRIPEEGDLDRLEYTGEIQLARDGSAKLELRQAFYGKYAVSLRAGLEQVPEPQLRDVIESRLLGSALPGAKLASFEVQQRDELEKPAFVQMQATLAGFAEARPGQLLIEPPLMPRVARLATLPVRQTPLLIRESTRQRVRLAITLSPGSRISGATRGEIKERELSVVVNDRVEGNRLTLDREVYVPAGRISVEEYPRFLELTRAAHGLLTRPVTVELADERRSDERR